MNRLQRLFFMAGSIPNKQNYIVLSVIIASVVLTIVFGLLAITYNLLLWRLLFVLAFFPAVILIFSGSTRLFDWSFSNKQERARIEKEEAARLLRGWVEVSEREEKKREDSL